MYNGKTNYLRCSQMYDKIFKKMSYLFVVFLKRYSHVNKYAETRNAMSRSTKAAETNVDQYPKLIIKEVVKSDLANNGFITYIYQANLPAVSHGSSSCGCQFFQVSVHEWVSMLLFHSNLPCIKPGEIVLSLL